MKTDELKIRIDEEEFKYFLNRMSVNNMLKKTKREKIASFI